VDWSILPDFSTLQGTKEIRDIGAALSPVGGRIVIDGLPLGAKFAFRLSAASIWGWAQPKMAEPFPLRISSWTELLAEDGTNGEEAKSGRIDPTG
jgi:hypothetical protein